MADKGFKRKLAAILSADVVGYSRLMEGRPSELEAQKRKFDEITKIRFRHKAQNSIASKLVWIGFSKIFWP